MTTTFENAKVGDKVWDFSYGWGEVVTTNFPNPSFPLLVRFTTKSPCGGDLEKVYTTNGHSTKYQNRTLFWDEIKFEAPEQPPRTKIINGIEVPDISFKPSEHDAYYYPDPAFPTLVFSFPYRFTASENNEFRIKNNLCYPYTEEGKQAAMLHAKAMLGIKE